MKVAFKMKLKDGNEEEYKKRHHEIWPELKQLLHDNGVSDYAIFWDRDTNILFAVQEVDGDKGSQDLGTNPIVQRWWNYMEDLMDTNPDNSPVSVSLELMFYMK